MMVSSLEDGPGQEQHATSTLALFTQLLDTYLASTLGRSPTCAQIGGLFDSTAQNVASLLTITPGGLPAQLQALGNVVSGTRT